MTDTVRVVALTSTIGLSYGQTAELPLNKQTTALLKAGKLELVDGEPLAVVEPAPPVDKTEERRAYARSLGIRVDRRWNSETLESKITEAEEDRMADRAFTAETLAGPGVVGIDDA